MRRQTVYAGAVPLETDILSSNKNAMISIGHVLQDMLGTGTLFSGLGCVPTTVPGMTVNVNPGRAYSLQATDTGAWSSLSADAHNIVKQGILLDLVNFACPAPTTAGFSINYLIEGAFQEVDGGSTILPYYNAANPAVAFSGPNGTGTSNTTYRDNTVQLQLKPGAAATTGSQVTPTPDSGFNGLWVVTVPFGATTITSANISQYTGAPFLQAPLLSQIQAVPTTGRLLATTLFVGNGTHTPNALTTKMRIVIHGGGGGGGACSTAGAGAAAVGGGGNEGSCVEVWTGVFGAAAVVVGAAGLGGAAGFNSGVTGGNSSYSAGILSLIATGGVGGGPGGAGAPPNLTVSPSSNSANLIANAFLIITNRSGSSGGRGISQTTSIVQGGDGGSGSQGAGGRGAAAGAGSPASGYGSGGGGAGVGTGGTQAAGGLATQGSVYIEEYT